MNLNRKGSTGGFLSVFFISAAVIAYEIAVMKIFSVGNWSHFGSMAISIAMFGFGVFSVLLCVFKDYLLRHKNTVLSIAVISLGFLMVGANSLAQTVNFVPIFLVSDPAQKNNLLLYYIYYFAPFFAAAVYFGMTFLDNKEEFGKVYFANMAGSGIGGLIFLFSLYFLFPENYLLVALFLWITGAVLFFTGKLARKYIPWFVLAVFAVFSLYVYFPQLVVSQYKGISYAKKFEDSKLIVRTASPFGCVEIYSSSYFHFAPGLSDMAAVKLKNMPKNAYLGMFIDSDGPIGLAKKLKPEEEAYFDYLPGSMPYRVSKPQKVFISQLGGGLSTQIALKEKAGSVVISESNPVIPEIFKNNKFIKEFTGDFLRNPRVSLLPYEARIALEKTGGKFDLIDFSLADSTGLSMPGGFSVGEKYTYTCEAFNTYLKALNAGGIFSLTVWNKEDPPKSTLKLLETFARAANARRDASNSVFAAQTYLSTLTVMYKEGGFTTLEIKTLEKYCASMSFEVIYKPSSAAPKGDRAAFYSYYRDLFFSDKDDFEGGKDRTAGNLYKTALYNILIEKNGEFASKYVFNVSAITDDRPFLAGFVRFKDIGGFIGKLEMIADEWGYLLLWATLAQALLIALVLLLIPVAVEWKTVFSFSGGKTGVILYFACLGLGYMIVELALIGKLILILTNPAVSVSLLIAGMLVFSGLGSLVSGRLNPSKSAVYYCAAIAVALFGTAFLLDKFLYSIAGLPYILKLCVCIAAVAPVAFLMGFPFALGMSQLGKTNKEHFFIWSWGINGSFSVSGSVLTPLLAVSFGYSNVFFIASALYLSAAAAFMLIKREAKAK
ncbi:MAG: hypothetical protein WCI43_01420 [Candidatus Firestonebacteria bacterium]